MTRDVDMIGEKYTRIERLKKLIDKIAYFSLFLDICIAAITSFSIFHIGNPETILVPVNYLLTVVVILSIGLFIALFTLKHEEDILDKLLNRNYRYKPKKKNFFR